MNLARWQRIEELFAELTTLPPEERARHLETLVPHDESLRREVASLLECDATGQMMERVVRKAAAAAFQVETSAGERLGSYQLIRKLGQGGMGTVFLAVRADDQYQQQVAIKLLSLGMETAQSVERFRQERQILASLEHPYIARLLDGGSAKVSGLPHETPYFVMEFVEGEPVNRYCERRQLDVTARLRLFLKICEAVTYAHRKLVVHRDLKPANILVTPEGVPKLLDFGVAKLLTEDGLGSFQTIAGLGMTPDFASPEQVLEEPITTATDVYSLGAILFLLLTGAKPHRFSNYSAREIRRVICETEAPKLTSVATESSARLRGDLEAIVSMAMRREPERRYPSVEQFSADLQRSLNGWPVIARPDRFSYRAGKFIRRQAYGLAAAGLVTLSLAIGLVVSLYQARRAEAESEHARQRLGQMVDLANVALSESYAERISGATEDHDQFMTSSTELLRQLSRETGNPRLRSSLVTAYLRLGELQSDLQSPNRGGLHQAIRILTEGAALLEPLPPLESTQDQASIMQWIDLRTFAGKAMLELGDAAEGRKHLQETLRVANGLTRARSGDHTAEQRECLIRHWISGTYEAESDYSHAIEITSGTLDALNKLERAFPNDASVIYDLSVSETRFGYEKVMLGDPEAAAPHYERTIGLRERAVRLNPNQMVYRRALKIAYEHMAGLMGSPLVANLGRPDEARKYLQQARLLEESAFDDPQRHLAQTDYAHFLLMASIIDTRPSEIEASLAGLRRAAAVYEAFAALEPDLINTSGQLSTIYTYMGHRLSAQAKFSEATAEYKRGLAVAERVLSKLPTDEKTFRQVMEASGGLARSLASSGNRVAAMELAARLQIRAGESRSTDAAVRAAHAADARLTLAEVNLTLGDRNAACSAARDAIGHIQPYAPASLRRSDRRATLLREAQSLLSACEAVGPGSSKTAR